MFRRLPKFLTNFYFLVGTFFLIWMLFIDSNDFYSQYVLRKKLKEMEKEKNYYEQKIVEVKSEREALLNNDDLLEKFAREKYFMKKENEDVFVVSEEKE
ncbi:MAG: septum formation initiator family protein [Bacteroidota bacterium]